MTNKARPGGLIHMIESLKPAIKPADIARRSGGRIPPQRLYTMLSRGELKAFPTKETIEGLAAGMGVPISEVVLAAARDRGIDVQTSGTHGDNDLVIHDGKLLSPELRAFVMQAAHLAKEWESSPTEADAAADPEPAEGSVVEHDDQSSMDLAAYKQGGMTDSERRDASLPSPEDESQDTGSDEPA